VHDLYRRINGVVAQNIKRDSIFEQEMPPQAGTLRVGAVRGMGRRGERHAQAELRAVAVVDRAD